MIAAVARAPWARISRARRAQVAVLAWAVVTLAFAFAAHRRGAAHAADRVLLDAYGPLVVPLLAYALSAALVGARSLSVSVAAVGAFGAPPARAAATTVAMGSVICAAVCGLLGAAAAATAHAAIWSHGAWRDVLASAYACGLGGAAYAAWFALGSTFGRRGGGRLAFLLLDWAVGANESVVALVTPRAHLRNLLGGTPPMEISERASSVALVGILAACAILATWRVRR